MPEDKILVHIALDDSRIDTLKKLLEFYATDVKVIIFPAWDCLPYDRVSPHIDIVAQRVAALCVINAWQNEKKRYPRIVLTSINAALQRVMPKDVLEGASFNAKIGERIDVQYLTRYLSQNGYVRSDTVREPGDFAVRGGLIDLYPAGYKDPLRVDFLEDEIESIKTFDSLSQRTKKTLKEFSLQPVQEFFLDEKSIARFRAGYREAFGVQQKDDPLYNAVSEGRRYNGMEHWLPLFHEKMNTLFDYTGLTKVTCDFHVPDAYTERRDQTLDFYKARKILTKGAVETNKKQQNIGSIYHPIELQKLFLTEDEWNILAQNVICLAPFDAPEEAEGIDNNARSGRNFSDVRALQDGDVFAELKTHILKLQGQGISVFIAAYSEGSKVRLRGLMEIAGITAFKDVAYFKDAKTLKSGEVGLCVIPLEKGFKDKDVAFISEQDILGDRLARKVRKNRKADNFLTEVSSLSEGNLVVHIDHGIGRFIALETIRAVGIVNDCLKIEYAGGDKLYVPVVNLDVLSRFGSDDNIAQLDKLGGTGWQARKVRAKKNLMEIADKLLGIAAARQLKKAQTLKVGEGLYNEFVSRFPYEETEDQERSINAVLEDMAGSYPMDHLVCGDVGFGKTEVALRAAYVAAMSGAQVALVVPTTLLARQHYKNFIKRFEGTGIRIEQLSRMVSACDAKRTKEGLADGSVQIVIGTHALFAKSIKFADIGLLIVDEEQRFGVKQKERLKELKSTVHVLTLTATPIPRTLQMSLTGVKEMSLITTPPVDRLAIRTFVMPVDIVVIRDALLREFYRGGQSFYVVPRIKDIKEVAEMLREIVPEVNFIEAHGQMSATELEDRMSAFYDGQYNILLATNIIESGIDIPSANTMIIHRADMFGLSQLYQIRGRIGRSKQRAYAYLTYQPDKVLTQNAQKRLEVMETLDTLGSGFQLASYDMDIRGAGNLLGDAQSGHIREIGVELYQQMLEEAVAAARAGITDIEDMSQHDWSPQINLGASVLIPENYVQDLGVRMSLYRRLNDFHDKQEIEAFAAEMIDRFGVLPDEVENLFEILAIKQLCKRAGVLQVEAGPKGALIAFYNNQPPNVDGVMNWITRKAGSVKIRPDQKLSVIRSWPKPMNRIKGMQVILKELAALSPDA
ncbi:MAG: transcription-repair coupling factor [Alphaproteobacteria bacterium]|nr:transcription-repair coupling factor [Alphaproteobacteria bacterium]